MSEQLISEITKNKIIIYPIIASPSLRAFSFLVCSLLLLYDPKTTLAYENMVNYDRARTLHSTPNVNYIRRVHFILYCDREKCENYDQTKLLIQH